MRNEDVVALADVAVVEYLTDCEVLGSANAVPFATWIEKAADSIPDLALDKLARKIFIRKASEFFARTR